MLNYTVKAITVLDMVLILMTAAWILFGVYRSLSLVELTYNWVYAIVSVATLILNLRLIYEKK